MPTEPPDPLTAFAEGAALRKSAHKLSAVQFPAVFAIASQEFEFGCPWPDPDDRFPFEDFDAADFAVDAWEKEEAAQQAPIRQAVEQWIVSQDVTGVSSRIREFMKFRFQTAARFTRSIPPGFFFDGSYTDLLRTMLADWWESSGRTYCLLHVLPPWWTLVKEPGRFSRRHGQN